MALDLCPPRGGDWTKYHMFTDGSVKDADDEIAAWALILVMSDPRGFSYAGRYGGKVADSCRTMPTHALTSTDSEFAAIL
eukprot:4053055-Pyramimonas_sp.AAC.1